jgi:hypothetical protein
MESAKNSKRQIEKLKRYQFFEWHMARLLGGWLPGVCNWEAKHTLAEHIWQDMRHSQSLRTRLWELRVMKPDRGLPDALPQVFTSLAGAQADYEMLAGVYLVLGTRLLGAYQRYVASTFEVYDHPSVLVLKQIIPAREAQLDWAKRTLDTLINNGDKRRQVQRWMRYAEDVLAAIGGIDGDDDPQDTQDADWPTPPPGYRLLLPFAEAQRDERFEVVIGGLPMPDEHDRMGYVLWQFANYVQEMQAAETLATILWEVEGMDWEFYFDIARHCWDESRHSLLGEQRLKQLGYHVADFPSSIGSYAWRQLFDPLTRYCALTYVIEADSFKLKHESYQRHMQAGDTESAEAVMYDIMDETMHVRFGTKWVPQMMQHQGCDKPLDDLIAECREIVLSHSVAPAQRVAAS